MSGPERADVVIVGGAIIGSSVATFLAGRPDFDGRIVVVERDPTFRTSSTTLSAASIRLQFSTPLNIEISQFGVEFLKSPDRYLAVDGEVPEVDFVENGYLFLATDAGLPTLEHNHAVQRALGVPVELLTPAELQARFDWLHTDDLAGASLGLADEGWFDAYALLQGFRRKARSLGVEERIGEVVELLGTATASRAFAWPMARRSRPAGSSTPPDRARPRSRPWSASSCRSVRASGSSTTSRRR